MADNSKRSLSLIEDSTVFTVLFRISRGAERQIPATSVDQTIQPRASQPSHTLGATAGCARNYTVSPGRFLNSLNSNEALFGAV